MKAYTLRKGPILINLLINKSPGISYSTLLDPSPPRPILNPLPPSQKLAIFCFGKF